MVRPITHGPSVLTTRGCLIVRSWVKFAGRPWIVQDTIKQTIIAIFKKI